MQSSTGLEKKLRNHVLATIQRCLFILSFFLFLIDLIVKMIIYLGWKKDDCFSTARLQDMSPQVSREWWEVILHRHDDRRRRYHTTQHIEDLMGLFDTIGDEMVRRFESCCSTQQ